MWSAVTFWRRLFIKNIHPTIGMSIKCQVQHFSLVKKSQVHCWYWRVTRAVCKQQQKKWIHQLLMLIRIYIRCWKVHDAVDNDRQNQTYALFFLYTSIDWISESKNEDSILLESYNNYSDSISQWLTKWLWDIFCSSYHNWNANRTKYYDSFFLNHFCEPFTSFTFIFNDSRLLLPWILFEWKLLLGVLNPNKKKRNERIHSSWMGRKRRWERCIKVNKHTSNTSISI